MAKDLVLDVIARKSSKDLQLLAAEFDKLANSADDTGTSFKKTGDFSKYLEDQISKTKGQVRQLGEEFKRTGNADVFASLKGAERNLKVLENFSKEITKSVNTGFEDGGKQGVQSLSATLQGFLKTPIVGPITVGVAGALAAVLAPAIASAIGAAFIGTAALGTIGLGIASQIQSPRVQAAFGQLKAQAIRDLTEAGSSFEPVIVNGLHVFSGELDRIRGEVERNVSKLAGPAGHLFQGLADAVDRLGPGIDAITSAAAPFTDVLADELPRAAAALSQALSDISSEAPGAILFLHDFFTLLDGGIITLGKFAAVGEKTYGLLRIFAKGLGGDAAGAARDWETLRGQQDAASKSAKATSTNMQVAAASIDLAGGEAESASKQYGSLISAMNETNNTADKVAGAMSDKIFNATLSLDHAALGFAESQTKLSQALAENGRQLDIHTEKGQANREAILGAVEANIKQYDANIAAGESAQEAAAAYDQNTQALVRQLQQAGFTQAQIDGLIGKYKQVPDEVNTNIALEGLTDAINGLDDLIRTINHIPSKTITIEGHVYTNVPPSQFFHGGALGTIHSYATGGIRDAGVYSNGPILFAEPQTGGEAFIPRLGNYSRSTAILDQAARWYGGRFAPAGRSSGPVAATLNVNGNGPFAQLIKQMLRTGELSLSVDSSGRVS